MDPLYQIARYVVGPKIEQKCTIVLLMYFKEENDFAFSPVVVIGRKVVAYIQEASGSQARGQKA